MRALCAFCMLSTLTVALVAQSKIISSPPGFEAKDSGGLPNSFAGSFGRDFDHRDQFADGEMRGRKMSITRIGYRLSYLQHTSSSAMGRSWTRVTLRASQCELDKLTTNFAQNSLTTPKTVFDGAVTWPTATGYPGTRPAPWDNRLSFPFAAPWSYDGNKDILWDYEFKGGVLANQVTTGRSYYLDTIRFNSILYGSQEPLSNVNPPYCADSAHTNPGWHAATSLWAAVHTYEIGSRSPYNGKVVFRLGSVNTAPNATVIHGVSNNGFSRGLDVAFRCDKLHVDTSKLFNAFYFKTDANGAFVSAEILAPWRGSFLGQRLWVQGAWSDSKTGYASLTKAMTLTMPTTPPNPPRRANLDSGFASGPILSQSPSFNPVALYTYN